MKRMMMLMATGLCLLLAGGAIGLFSQGLLADGSKDGSKDGGKEEPDWKAMAEPGEMHKILNDYFAGDWTVKCKMWMGGKDPVESEGQSKCKMVLGGRYLTEEMWLGNKAANFEFNALSLCGYDNLTKEFHFTFSCDWATSIDKYFGSYDAKANTLTLTTTGQNDFMGSFSSRVVISLTSKDEHKVEVFSTYDKNPEVKEVEILSKRKK